MQCSRCSGEVKALAEPPSANGFEFTLYGCEQCDDKAMYCVCVATALGGWEKVSKEDADVILSGAHPDLKGFMQDWQQKVIGA